MKEELFKSGSINSRQKTSQTKGEQKFIVFVEKHAKNKSKRVRYNHWISLLGELE